MKEYFGYILVFLATFAGVEIFRRWSLRRELLDLPNERSSHTIPTPRGGGLIIVAVCLLAFIIFCTLSISGLHWSYLVGAFSIALISWIDDLYTISSIWRFAVHIASAILAISTLGYFQEISIPLLGNFNIGVIGIAVTFFWIVWLTNAYNFMDGIDGIAGIQALTAGIGWLILGDVLDIPLSGFYGGSIAFSALGFLILNWQPARIFMGDVGSAFLGYTFAVLPLIAMNEPSLKSENRKFLFPAAILVVWLFLFDTLWTIGRRFLKGEKVWKAHRSHLYQKFVIRGFSHAAISLLYGILSISNVTLLIFCLINKQFGLALTLLVLIQSIFLAIGGFLFSRSKLENL